MRKILLIVIAALLVAGANAQWVSNGPDSTTVQCLAVNGTAVLAGTAHQGIFLSTDSGGSWTAVNTGLPYTTFEYVSAIAVSSQNVFAATVGKGVFLSTNNGGNWIMVNNGLGSMSVFALAINGSNIFASTSSGVYTSTDNGSNWSAANTGISRNVGSFTVGNGVIYAATDSLVYSSTNNGGNWTAVSNTGMYGTPFYSLAVNGSQLFAGTYNAGVFLLNSDSGTWIPEVTYLPIVGYLSSIVVYNDSNIIVSDYGSGVYFITNLDIDSGYGGWSQLGTGLVNAGVSSLAVNGNYIFAGTAGSGVWQMYLPPIFYTGISDVTSPLADRFSLYPNPNQTGLVEYSVADELVGSKLKLYDITGKLLLTQTIKSTSATIDISTLAAGMYIVNIKSVHGIESKKLAVTK